MMAGSTTRCRRLGCTSRPSKKKMAIWQISVMTSNVRAMSRLCGMSALPSHMPQRYTARKPLPCSTPGSAYETSATAMRKIVSPCSMAKSTRSSAISASLPMPRPNAMPMTTSSATMSGTLTSAPMMRVDRMTVSM